MASIFGWSYPPGCSGPPGDDFYCEVCGARSDLDCVCPECNICGDIANPKCYEIHGLILSDEQKEMKKKSEEYDSDWEHCEPLTEEE